MTELDVLNKMLATLGEAPLQDLDEEHPLVPAAKRQIVATIGIELGRGWWFNRETVELHPDPHSGFVYVPGDTLSVDPAVTTSHLVQRGRRLYDTQNSTYSIAETVTVKLVRGLPFEDLPPNAQVLIAAEATVRFNLDYEGDRQKLEEAKAESRIARIELGREEIRNTDVNLFRRASTAAMLNRISTASGRLRSF